MMKRKHLRCFLIIVASLSCLYHEMYSPVLSWFGLSSVSPPEIVADEPNVMNASSPDFVAGPNAITVSTPDIVADEPTVSNATIATKAKQIALTATNATNARPIALCHKTLFGDVDFSRIVYWAKYHHDLGFDDVCKLVQFSSVQFSLDEQPVSMAWGFLSPLTTLSILQSFGILQRCETKQGSLN